MRTFCDIRADVRNQLALARLPHRRRLRFWLLAYGLFYWASRLSLDSFSSVVLYLGYLLLLVLLDFLVTGTVSFRFADTQR